MRAVAFHWDGEVMRPLRPEIADEVFVVGLNYLLAPPDIRSEASHRHFFAWLREAWGQLPESLAGLYPTPDHLRKHAMIEAGFYNETILDVSTNAAALRTAALMRQDDEFASVVVRGSVVVRRTAKSMKPSQMPPADFKRCKSAVMEVVAALIGVSPDAIGQNAGRAA